MKLLYDVSSPSYLFLFLAGGKHKIAHCSLACCQHALSIQRYIHLFAIWQEQISSAIIVHFTNSALSPFATTFHVLASLL